MRRRRTGYAAAEMIGVSRVDRAYDAIKAGIIEGRYPPGAPLSESLLAEACGMSRTPIREGLSRLHSEHYLDRIAGRGYFVAHVTLQAIRDTFDVRRLLEGWSAARAAELRTEADVVELRALAHFPITNSDYREAEHANARFHLAVASTTGNRLALELTGRSLAQVDRFMALGVSFGPLQVRATEAHLGIVDAIAAHDLDGARRLMEEHLDLASRGMEDALLRRGQAAALRIG